MKTLFILTCSFLSTAIFSQNVKMEITDYEKEIDNKKYSTYQYVNASYSLSRPLIIFIMNNNNFLKLHNKVSQFYKKKQEYTDVELLGIDNFDKYKITVTENKIISVFLNKIIKYRTDNNLPTEDEKSYRSQIIFLEKESDICNFLFCK